MEKFACMYLRLSREDGDSTESNSISNQRQIIKSYARDNDFKVVAEYVDDGFSGSNFDRPKFKKMIQDLEEKKFKTIIVKDLSRFGRDYIESGKYLQKIFPEKGIRFISVNDNYDSENADVSDTHLILPIRNFINDSYCRDISMKVKSSKEIKRKNGEFIGAFAPFGYKKDSKNKHKLVVDTEVSHIIERIFNMKIDGYSSKAIADFLNSIGCVTPSKHKENSGDNHTTGFIVKDSKWDAKMVNRIITNKVYIGVLEQGKTRKLNYKSKREVEVNEEDWIVINDSHKPIISKSIYALANKMMLRDVKQSADIPHILSGMLYCKDCGSSMVRRKVKSKNGCNIFYICSHYNNKGDCTRHSIKEDYLLDMTLFALKDYLKKYNELLSQVNKLDVSKVTFNIDFESLNSEKRKYERLRQSLYMDLEDELITSEEFERFRKNYLIKIREIEKQISTKKNILANLQEKMKNKDSLVSEIVPTDLSSLNRLTIVSFIDRIEIGENNEINYVFNNLETVNLLKTLIKEESESKSEVKKNLISINKVFGNALENKTPMQLVGGVL